MSKLFRHRYQVYLLGGIFTLSILSLIGMNLFLSANNQVLKRARKEAQVDAALTKIYLQLELMLNQSPLPASLFDDFHRLFIKEGLLVLQIVDRQDRVVYVQMALALPEDVTRKFTAAEIMARQPAPEQILQDTFALPPSGRLPVTLGRAVLYSPELQPKYFLAFMLRNVDPLVMDSFEQLTLLFQTIFVICLLAIFWYFIRIVVRPYETLIQEIKKSPDNVKPRADSYQDEISFLVGSFKDVIRQLQEKERQLAGMHQEARQRADFSEKYARDVLAGLPQAVLSLDQHGFFLDGNPAIESLLGRKKVALLNLDYGAIFNQSPGLTAIIKDFFQNHAPVSVQGVALVLPAGEERLLQVSISPLTNPQGVFYGAACVLEDLTSQNQLQQQLQTRENLATLGEMAAGIAHEFKNSLSTISGYSQMILGNARPGAEQKRAAALVQEVEGMARVISDFLEYARPMPADRTPLALDRLLEELLAAFREKYPDIEFRAELGPADVLGEHHLLKKAFHNLFLNAVQAIEIRKGDSGKLVWVRLEFLSGKMIRVQVEDNGPGMDDKTLGRVFTPFFTTRPDGTGMGMAVVQKIVAIHEGSILIRSELGRGTTVEVDLPSCSGPPLARTSV